MAARLRSITKRIPWSLLLKAGFLALVWAVLPFWIFAIMATAFYAVPFFRARSFITEFIILLILAAVFQNGVWTAALFGALFLLLFGIKDLVIVDRARGYEAFALLAAFLASIALYGTALGSSWRGITPFLAAAAFGLISALLLRRLPFDESFTGMNLPSALGGFFLWQLAFILIFLPLNFFEAAAVLFLFFAGMASAITAYEKGSAGESDIVISFAMFTAAAFAALLMAPWRV